MHGWCADHYMLSRERNVLKNNKGWYDWMRADLQQLREEGDVRTETKIKLEQREQRSWIADFKEEATTIANIHINCKNKSIEHFEGGLRNDRVLLSKTREAFEHIVELEDKKVRKENYFTWILRIYFCLQFLQEIWKTKPQYHVLPPKQKSPTHTTSPQETSTPRGGCRGRNSINHLKSKTNT